MNLMKVILLTGATDGIGLEAAKTLVADGHHLLIHGRSPTKLQAVQEELLQLIPENGTSGKVETYQADLSNLTQVDAMATDILAKHESIDVLMNNAGVLKSNVSTVDVGKNLQIDQRLVVNTIAPYLLTKRLMPTLLSSSSNNKGSRRIVNLSSAAQATVDVSCLTGGLVGATEPRRLSESEAYAQSKLAILQWTFALAADLANAPPGSPESRIVATALNPASLIGTKMVKEGYGIAGKDLSIGRDILVQAATSKKFGDARASGKYFDNDRGQFGHPHHDAEHSQANLAIRDALDQLLVHLEYNIE